MIGRWTHWAVDRFREQPFGEYVYLTGRTFARLPKKLWVADQPGRPDGLPPEVQCSHTAVGRASRALLLGRPARALSHLREASQAGIAREQVEEMIRELTKHVQSAPVPVSVGAFGGSDR